MNTLTPVDSIVAFFFFFEKPSKRFQFPSSTWLCTDFLTGVFRERFRIQCNVWKSRSCFPRSMAFSSRSSQPLLSFSTIHLFYVTCQTFIPCDFKSRKKKISWAHGWAQMGLHMYPPPAFFFNGFNRRKSMLMDSRFFPPFKLLTAKRNWTSFAWKRLLNFNTRPKSGCIGRGVLPPRNARVLTGGNHCSEKNRANHYGKFILNCPVKPSPLNRINYRCWYWVNIMGASIPSLAWPGFKV